MDISHGQTASDSAEMPMQKHLCKVIMLNQVDVVKELLNRGANVNVVINEDGETPLFIASRCDDTFISRQIVFPISWHTNKEVFGCGSASVRLLLLHGADPNKQNKVGRTPLHEAAFNGCTKVAGLLLDHCADLNSIDKCGNTTLSLACDHNYSDFAGMLCMRGADVQTTLAWTPLHSACYNDTQDWLRVVELLLDNGADPNCVTDMGDTALLLACSGRNANADIVAALLKHGGDVTVGRADKEGLTPLHEAARCGSIKVIKLLLELKADPNARSSSMRTPLWFATDNGQREVVQLLANEGVDLSVAALVTYNGIKFPYTPLRVAIEHQDYQIFWLLINAGLYLSQEDWLMKKDFPSGLDSENPVLKQLLDLASNPLSLLQLVRQFIRHLIGHHIKHVVPQLEIPNSLIRYLLLDD